MATIRPFLGCLGIGICLYAAGVSVADYQQVATGADPHRVTAQSLRDELQRTGLAVRFTDPKGLPVPSVTGVARHGSAVVGFEFQLFPSSDVATVRQVGLLDAEDFGWPRRDRSFFLDRWVRGVIANVAFAEYEQNVIEGPQQTFAEAHEAQLAEQRVQRALDDALFHSFPEDDPYAHALLRRP
jgi:hypothetical protein